MQALYAAALEQRCAMHIRWRVRRLSAAERFFPAGPGETCRQPWPRWPERLTARFHEFARNEQTGLPIIVAEHGSGRCQLWAEFGKGVSAGGRGNSA